MAIQFGPLAPHCPVNRDQDPGVSHRPPPRIFHPMVPRAHDLPSALAAINIAKTIITNLVFDKVINNVHTPPMPAPRVAPPAKIINKEKKSSWSLQSSMTVKRKYKYYAVDKNGNKDKDTWIQTERIERMVWYDKSWKTSLAFVYGEKGEGEPQ